MKKGQALIEIMMAIAVAVIALLAISRTSSKSVYNTGAASRQNSATGYAQSAVNMVKERINSLGSSAKTDPRFITGVYCYDGTNIVTSTNDFCQIGTSEFFGRVVMQRSTINFKDELSTVVEIRWYEGNLTRMVKNETRIVLDK